MQSTELRTPGRRRRGRSKMRSAASANPSRKRRRRRCGARRLRVQGRHVRVGGDAAAAFRRHGLVAAVGMTAMLPRARDAKAPPGAVEYPVPADSTKEPGRVMGEDGGYGSRSQFESEVRWVNPTRTASFVPMQNSYGTITPSGTALRAPSCRHPEHRSGQAPPRHSRPRRPADQVFAGRLKRFPTISRTYFMECSGTTGSELMKVSAADGAADPRPGLHIRMDRRTRSRPCSSRPGSSRVPPGCSPRAPTARS